MKLGLDSLIQIVSLFQGADIIFAGFFFIIVYPEPRIPIRDRLPGQILSNPIDSHRKANI